MEKVFALWFVSIGKIFAKLQHVSI
jgi:hypothetical protein